MKSAILACAGANSRDIAIVAPAHVTRSQKIRYQSLASISCCAFPTASSRQGTNTTFRAERNPSTVATAR